MAMRDADISNGDPLNLECSNEEWSIRWWRWLLSIPRVHNPALDSTGMKSGVSQENVGVFFLCQTLGNSKTQIFRKASVPRGKTLFMPIINWISVSGIDGDTLQQLNSVAKKKIDAVTDLQLKVNGRAIEDIGRLRIRSPCFDVVLPEDNILGLVSGRRTCVSDGYWVFLKPEGNAMTLRTFGSCSSGVNKIGIAYYLTIS